MRVLPKREGFTLIEILVAMLIVGVLAAIAIKVFWQAKDRSLQTTLQTDLKSLAVYQEQYFSDHEVYAPDVGSLPQFDGSPGVIVSITNTAPEGWAAVTTHPSIPGTQCGLFVGTVAAANAPPATQPGIVMCTGQ